MKLSLVVAEGVHKGKAIPVPVAQFVIGRDEGCQLRPSSPAVSKRHCAIHLKDGKIFVQDFGSTNGTFVNDQPVTGETEVKSGDKLVVGPLVFQIRLEESATAPAATKGDAKAETKPTEGKAPPPKPAAKPEPKLEPKPEPAAAVGPTEDESESLAALLLGTDDGPAEPLSPSDIPDGTTVFEMPAVGGAGQKPDAKPAGPLPSTSNAADAILRKYMRRPRA